MSRWGRHWWKVAAVALAAIGAIWYLQSDMYAYSKAERLFGAGRYHESALAFQALGGYRDSEERTDESIYREAEACLGASDTTTALQLFDSVRTYSDSEDRISQIIISRFRDRMTFVQIPSGSFLMGLPLTDSGRDPDEGPVHAVSVQGFELMTTEVTQSLWEVVMGSNPAHDYGVGSGYPVYFVSWNDCQEFIDRLNSLDTEYEYRLPTEAEWEYACRSGMATRFYWGDDPDGQLIGQYCWYAGNSADGTQPVGQKLPNAWGLYDMSGNVWEWCGDVYHDTYDGAPADGSAWVSPSGFLRVDRGGSWGILSEYCRSADRSSFDPGSSVGNLGLRLARSAR